MAHLAYLFFFVLSGFLISYLLIQEYETHQKISLKYFYIRRILRIWPLYFLVIMFTFGIYPFIKSLFGIFENAPANIWYHLSFLTNFDVIRITQQNLANDPISQDITWSVAIEEQFYAFWPLLFVFIRKRFWMYAILLITSCSIIFRIANENNQTVLYFHSLSVLIDLCIGSATALLITQYKRIRNFFENATTNIHIILFLIAFGCMYSQHIITAHVPYGNAFERVIIATSFVLVIAAQAITKKESIFNLSNLSFANKWGKYTYGIYLLHPIAILFVEIIAKKMGYHKTDVLELTLLLFIKLALTLVLSKISYVFYKSYFLSLKQKFSVLKTQH
jgi:peptidoglycan/LPS O-acetylase OafA/YrhL